jgi:hypothetical protein
MFTGNQIADAEKVLDIMRSEASSKSMDKVLSLVGDTLHLPY